MTPLKRTIVRLVPRSVRLFIRSAYTFVDTVIESAGRHHIFLLASGITFNIAVFILPTILAILFIMSLFTDAAAILAAIETLIEQSLPPGENSAAIMDNIGAALREIFDSASNFGWIGIPALLWISTTLFGSLRTALNGVFEIPQTGFFLKHKLKDVGFLMLFAIMVLLSSVTLTVITILESVGRDWVPDQHVGLFSEFTAFVSSAVITFAFFLFIYYFIPNAKLPRFVLFSSTILATILWEIARFVYAWYVSDVASYGKFYGTYAVVVISAIWLYYSSLIVLLSAEIARFWYKSRQLSKKKRGSGEQTVQA